MEKQTDFQRGPQGWNWTNQPPQGPQGPYYGTPWGFHGPWGWWNGPTTMDQKHTDDQTEGTEKNEGNPTPQGYGDYYPYNYFGSPYTPPTGWNTPPWAWWMNTPRFTSGWGAFNERPYYNPYTHPFMTWGTGTQYGSAFGGYPTWSQFPWMQGGYRQGFPNTPYYANRPFYGWNWTSPYFGGQDYGWNSWNMWNPMYGNQSYPYFMGTPRFWSDFRHAPMWDCTVAA